MTPFVRLSPEQHDTLEGFPEPAENPHLIGHHAARELLLSSHGAGRLPQGLILAGPHGIGKATVAFHLARHLLRFPDGAGAPQEFAPAEPSGSLFRQVASEAHPSVLHLTRPLNEKGERFKTVLAVDEVRRIGRFLSHTAHDGGYRIVIVDPADDLNTAAANALLKNLEEPPARTLFVLVAHSLGRLLPTLRSRCQVLKLSPLPPADLIAASEAIGAALPAAEADRQALAARANGSVREALLLLEHGGLAIATAVEALASSARFSVVEAHRLAEQVSGKGKEAPFALLHRHALDLLSDAAARAAQAGEIARAASFSEAWEQERATGQDTLAYNLDRKQAALDTVHRLHTAFQR
ncbi:MAG TPA: DNA polymerase III subunit delta' [Mesorhizobium sp.]|nr:DNA polymerase III subunit delta' [Mesorhizobium sp.]